MLNEYQFIEKNNAALAIIDKLILLLPDYASFDISTFLKTFINWPEEEKKSAYSLKPIIETILVDRLHYADRIEDGSRLFLTETGREVKRVGGHFRFQKKYRRNDWIKRNPINYEIVKMIISAIFGSILTLSVQLIISKTKEQTQIQLPASKNSCSNHHLANPKTDTVSLKQMKP